MKFSRPLQSIRFIAAVLIFLHHVPFFDTDPQMAALNTRVFYYFFSPVTFFFILSGWSLTSAYYEKVKNKTFRLRSYFMKRILRLYPLHIITFLLMIPLIAKTLPLIPKSVTIANILLVHAFFPSPMYLLSYNGISWCLSIFLFLYLVFPYVMLIISRFDTLMRKFALIVAFLLISGLAAWIYFNTFESGTPYILYFSPFERLIDYLVGVCIFFILTSIGNIRKVNRAFWTGMELGVLGLLITAHWFAYLIPEKFIWDVYFIIPWGLTIGVFALSKGLISRILSWKPLVLLGSISLEFFLMQGPVLRWVYSFMSLSIHLTPNELGAVAFVLTLLSSILVHNILLILFRPVFKTGSTAPCSGELQLQT